MHSQKKDLITTRPADWPSNQLENQQKSLLRLALEEQAPELATSLGAMHERAHRDWMQFLVPDRGSHAGYSHLHNVEHNLDKMLAGKMKLSPGEIFLLLSAALFHDIGRIYPKPESKLFTLCGSDPAAPICKDYLSKDDGPPCLNWHREHHKRSEHLISKFGLQLGFPDEKIRDYCALLAYCHGLDKPPIEPLTEKLVKGCGGCIDVEKRWKCDNYHRASVDPYEILRIPLLAALLRIADEAENHWTRAYGEQWLEEFDLEFKNQDALRRNPNHPDATNERKLLDAADEAIDIVFVKAFRRKIGDVEFSHAGQCIVVHLDVPEKLTESMAEDVRKRELKSYVKNAGNLQKTLDAWSGELKGSGQEFRRVFFKIGGKLQRIRFEVEDNLKEIKITDTSTDPGPQDVIRCKYPQSEADKETDTEDRIRRMKEIADAMIALSQATMGCEKFHLDTLAAQVGRKLDDLDLWLLERMDEWAHEAIQFDPNTQTLRIVRDKIEFIENIFVKKKISS
jgi:hypothetical protein